MRTRDTFVSLIWFDGWLIPTGILADYGKGVKYRNCVEQLMQAKYSPWSVGMVAVGQAMRGDLLSELMEWMTPPPPTQVPPDPSFPELPPWPPSVSMRLRNSTIRERR